MHSFSKQLKHLSMPPSPPRACPGPGSARRGWRMYTWTLTHSRFIFPSCPEQDLDVATWAIIHSSFCSLFKKPNDMNQTDKADYHMGTESSAFPCLFGFFFQKLIFLPISVEQFSGKPRSFLLSDLQTKIATLHTSSRLERQFSILVLTSKLVQLKYWKE